MGIMNKFKKVNLLFLLKTGIGSALAIILAESLGFVYSPSAGIITLLTIQNTKKETISIALRRIEAFLLAVIISYVLFNSIGYTAVAFGGFVFLFVAFCILFGLKDGIAMNAVLMTHFLIEKRMDLPLVLNEIALLFIGMGIGIVLNLIMPRYREKIRREQHTLEEEMKVTLRGMAKMLKEKDSCLIQGVKDGIKNKVIPIDNPTDNPIDGLTDNLTDNITDNSTDDSTDNSIIKKLIKNSMEYSIDKSIDYIDNTFVLKKVDFSQLDSMLESLLIKAYEDAGNTLLSNTKYLVSYLEMRKLQVGVLKDIMRNMVQIPVLLRQTFPITNFMENIAISFHELNNVEGLLSELDELQEHFKKEKLPQTRAEFEYRAILFQILKELEYFLLLKRNFILELESKNMKSYWVNK